MGPKSVGKYALYAAGEILLVVMGILIALQVNTWNEGNKRQKEEMVVLTEIVKNLREDLKDFDNNLTHLKNVIVCSRNLSRHLSDQLPWHDSLAYHIFCAGMFPHFSPNISGFELLQSKGLEIIKNDSVRQRISALYANNYPYLHTWEDERIEYNLLHINRLRNKYLGLTSLHADAMPASIRPSGFLNLVIQTGGIRALTNYPSLMQDKELLGALKDVEVHAKLLLEIHTMTHDNVLEIISQIEREIEVRS